MLMLMIGLGTAQEGEVTLTYDCLGGVCLGGSPVGTVKDKVQTVAGYKWHRTVEVCSDRIVLISLRKHWTTGTVYPYSDRAEYTNEGDPDWIRTQLHETLLEMGWQGGELVLFESGSGRDYTHPERRGRRSLIRASEEQPRKGVQTSDLLLVTTHPYKDELCRAKREHGL